MSVTESSRNEFGFEPAGMNPDASARNERQRNLERRLSFGSVISRLGILGRFLPGQDEGPVSINLDGVRYRYVEPEEVIAIFERAKSVDDAIERANHMYADRYDPSVIQQSAIKAGYPLVYTIDFGVDLAPSYAHDFEQSKQIVQKLAL